MATMKVCSICGEEKNLWDFSSISANKCKKCIYKENLDSMQASDINSRYKLSDGTIVRKCLKCNKIKDIKNFGYMYEKLGIRDCTCSDCRNINRTYGKHKVRWFSVLDLIKSEFMDKTFTLVQLSKFFPSLKVYSIKSHLNNLETMKQIYKIEKGCWKLGTCPIAEIPGSSRLDTPEKEVEKKSLFSDYGQYEPINDNSKGLKELLINLVKNNISAIDKYSFTEDNGLVSFTISFKEV